MKIISSCLLVVLFFSNAARSEEYYWKFFSLGGGWPKKDSAEAACSSVPENGGAVGDYIYSRVGYVFDYRMICYFYINGVERAYYSAERGGDGCSGQDQYNFATGLCESPDVGAIRKQRGEPDSGGCNAPSAKFQNPLNILTGDKYQKEVDFSEPFFEIYRIYNSSDGRWIHSYSDHLLITDENIALYFSDGRFSLFSRVGDTAISEVTEFGRLVKKEDTWVYISAENKTMVFDSLGRLVKISLPDGRGVDILYSGIKVFIKNPYGVTIELEQDSQYQILSFNAVGYEIDYKYNELGQLVLVSKIINNKVIKREYHYEMSGKTKLLTGITDERGVRYATWSYDEQNRAISSEHANRMDYGVLTYNADGSITVTNELDKKATYRFQVIQGVKRIVAIEGEPSPNCPSSNSTFTYDDRGLLKTKMDNKGYVTTYSYNDRGLEISRTEASGTAQARTTTTEWHPTLFLPETVTEPGRITHYQYDDQGRQLSQTIESL
ncbi:hypothetical protein [Pseudomonas sp. LRF_L74]|uniref:hypothetical protein n=1 Tax=Pseudomonas sp. LRF_L74 TaxID=3369422 RepID=UPI003F5FF5A9